MIQPIHTFVWCKFTLFTNDVSFIMRFFFMILNRYTLVIIFFFLIIPKYNYSQKKPRKPSSYHESEKNLGPENSPLLDFIIKANYDSLLPISANPNEYELQIIYTQIDRNENQEASFTTYTFGQKKPKYFYPASLVKLPTCALALEKINELQINNLNVNSYMFTDSVFICSKKILNDSSSSTCYPSLGNYIKKMLLVSDNNSYSRVYEFLGMDYIQNKLLQKNLGEVRIVSKFDGFCGKEDNKFTFPILFTNEDFDTLYFQKTAKSINYFNHPLGKVYKGKKQMLNNGRIIKKPKDFTSSNYLNLRDIDGILKRVIFPENFPEKERFNLKPEDYVFLKKYLSMWPRESIDPIFPDSIFEDSHKKYLIYGNYHDRIENDSVRIFNIVGQSYGTLADCAYIVNYEKGIEFFLSVCIYTNKNGIMNDGKYEYKSIGFPFLSKFGKVIYDYEYKREKTNLPTIQNSIPKYREP